MKQPTSGKLALLKKRKGRGKGNKQRKKEPKTKANYTIL